LVGPAFFGVSPLFGGSLGAVPRGAGLAGGGSSRRVLFLAGVGLDLPSPATADVVLTWVAKGSNAASGSNAVSNAALKAATFSEFGSAVKGLLVSGVKDPAPNGSNGA